VTSEAKIAKDHSLLKEKLQSKASVIVGEFSCRGLTPTAFSQLFGGMNKG